MKSRTCAGCGKTRGCDSYQFGRYWHFKCLLKERAKRGTATVSDEEKKNFAFAAIKQLKQLMDQQHTPEGTEMIARLIVDTAKEIGFFE